LSPLVIIQWTTKKKTRASMNEDAQPSSNPATQQQQHRR